jgi:hypothetical protein
MTRTLDDLARKLENENIAQAYDMGRDMERAAVVAWLGRPHAGGCHVAWCEACEERAYAAGAIERGEHRREEGP